MVRLANVLDDIVQICELKAEHIRYAWQDDKTAARWIAAGKAVASAADSLWTRIVSQLREEGQHEHILSSAEHHEEPRMAK